MILYKRGMRLIDSCMRRRGGVRTFSLERSRECVRGRYPCRAPDAILQKQQEKNEVVWRMVLQLLLSEWMYIRGLSECIYFVQRIPLHP